MSEGFPVSFSTFIVSLASSAMVHLGETPNPEDGSTSHDLALARNSIDLIAMLKEKTEGNLTDDEKKLVDTLLYDLRMRFVEAKKKA